jgi:hypothetical protein
MKHVTSGFLIHHGSVIMTLSMTKYTMIQVILFFHYQTLNRREISDDRDYLDRDYWNDFLRRLQLHIIGFALVEYFVLNEQDHLNNDSYIESSKIGACEQINITISSRVNSAQKGVYLALLLLSNQRGWHQVWNYTHDDSQRRFHQLQLDVSNESEQVQVNRTRWYSAIDERSLVVSISARLRFAWHDRHGHRHT